MSKVERERVIDFEYSSSMPDVGKIRMRIKLLRRTANVVTDIKLAKARMLGGNRAASGADDLHFDVMATLANGMEPIPNPTPLDPAAWIEDILDPACWYAIYDRWQDYQNSFSKAADDEASA